MNIIAIVLLFAIIGGGIYLWVRWQRNKIKAKRQELVDSANLLDSSGNVTSEALDRIIGQSASVLSNPANTTSPEVNGTNSQPGQNNGPAGVGSPASGDPTEADSANANSGSATAAVVPNGKIKVDPLVEKFRLAAPTIAELCQKLLVAWSQASEANSIYERASRDRSRAIDELGYSHGSSRARSQTRGSSNQHTALLVYIEKLRVMQLAIRSHSHKRAKAMEQLLLLPEAAKDAWNQLNQALMPFPEAFFSSAIAGVNAAGGGSLGTLSPDLVSRGLAAHQLKSVSKSSIEGLLKEASEAQENAESIRAEAAQGEASDAQKAINASAAIAENKNDLAERTIKAMLAVFAADVTRSEASSLFDELESLGRTRFKAPQKPTPEEVMRYLASVEDWNTSVLSTTRQAIEMLSEARKNQQQVKIAVAELQGAYQALSKKLLDGFDENNIAFALTITLIISDLNSSIERRDKAMLDLEQSHVGVKAPATVTAQTAADIERIKGLRLIARTAGFALAQATVADNKLSQLNNDEPDSAPNLPKIDRDQDFVSHVARFDQYIKRKNDHATAVQRWSAEKEIVAGALAARSEKVRENNKTMSTACATATKSFSATTCDELRVIVGMLEKLVLLNKPFEI